MVADDVKELVDDIEKICGMVLSHLRGVEDKPIQIDWLVREVLSYHLYLQDARHFRNIEDAARDFGQMLHQSLVE